MAILIKNPDTERKARELAQLRGQTITGVIDAALERELAETRIPKRRPTVAQMIAATDRFRNAVGLDEVKPSVTRADFDAINEIPGLEDDIGRR